MRGLNEPCYGVLVDARTGPNNREPEARVALMRQTLESWEMKEVERGSRVWCKYAHRARRESSGDVLYFPRGPKERDMLHAVWGILT